MLQASKRCTDGPSSALPHVVIQPAKTDKLWLWHNNEIFLKTYLSGASIFCGWMDDHANVWASAGCISNPFDPWSYSTQGVAA